VSDKENNDHHSRDVDKRIKQQTSKIEKLGASLKLQDESLSKNESALGTIERNMEALGEQAELMRADHLAMRAMQNEASNKLEGHRILLSKTQVDLQHVGDGLGKTNNNFNTLKESLAEANVNVSKLGNRYDACTKNILGMSKGFQDMSRHMNQGEGLLPSKSPRKLPELKVPTLESVERGNSINRMSPTSRVEVSYGRSTPPGEQ